MTVGGGGHCSCSFNTGLLFQFLFILHTLKEKYADSPGGSVFVIVGGDFAVTDATNNINVVVDVEF